ncbi:MAG TPA: hypothetical protein VNB90_08285 [Cytophagaceae bacterium]|jgi:hypothetical protein|nr:hypothetical protein [Cytophagaceae bacterium]
MKKFLILAFTLVLSTAVFSSCKKHYKCSCENGNIQNPYLHKLSKSEANSEKAKCEANAGCTFERDK